ncbi:hypothetical protein BX661DRAFT_142712 [Kickxella alabastrina]|uniref:uncharacterized protein n=1 Tax=Kickxella alabastrina TaxID=61397 RepID=UPI00221F227A|nr:uncharacterized protein BX661DRAFT_142712 [Kickxella alabastrina]KAI7829102.1 hypothetical protein BX661DRAFT_142712 [Kickxella alabastrina]
MIKTNDQRDKQNVQHLHLSEDDMDIILQGYNQSLIGAAVYWLLVVCSAGLLYIIGTWFRTIYIRLSLKRAPLNSAQYVQVLSSGKHISLESVDIVKIDSPLKNLALGVSETNQPKATAQKALIVHSALHMLTFRHYRLIFNRQLEQFVPVSMWKDPEWNYGNVTGHSGLCAQEYKQRLGLFGECIIDIDEKSYARLFWEEVLNPFYIFQLASIAIWCSERYYYYSGVILIISAISISSTLVSTKHTVHKIREMARYTCPVRVIRDGRWMEIQSSELVPGDVLDLANVQFSILPCEAILLEGDAIVNESMLTGESIAESKSPISLTSRVLPNINMSAHTFAPDVARHILFAGTQLIRVRGAHSSYQESGNSAMSNMRATAMVLRTGFCTTKGTLVRSILFPRPKTFRFYRDAFRFIGILAMVAVIGFIINSVNLHRLGVSTGVIVKKALDLITVTIPPALPAAIGIGMAFAAGRLRKASIFCTSPSRINVASKVSIAVFDKTGTLSELDLDMLGVCAVDPSTGNFTEICTSIEQAADAKIHMTGDQAESTNISVVCALATCHSLRLVNGFPVGDPLEAKMLEFSGWHIEEADEVLTPSFEKLGKVSDAKAWQPPTVAYPPLAAETQAGAVKNSSANPVGVFKVFEFSSALRRASVISQPFLAPHIFHVYAKGAPEVIRSICNPATVPTNHDQLLDQYTRSGHRVIALAGKTLCGYSHAQVRAMERFSAESDLVFMGLMVFENRLKPASARVLQELRESKIRMVMCTGDNALTAVSVVRECSLISPGTRVFVSQLAVATSSLEFKGSVSDIDLKAPLTRVSWKEATGESVVLDSVTLVPRAADSTDAKAVQMAAELAISGRYCVAVTGDAFTYLHSHAANRSNTWKHMLMRGAVYARMSPELKAELVVHLQKFGYTAGFCGDGANDCAALKSADIGVSLSEAEASVAAPFTSSIQDISCFIQILKEGRCSITTSFGCFKYMALYSIIQFTSCCLLYSYNVNLTDSQFLFIDLFIVLPIAVCMDRARPFSRLVPKRPSANLTSKKVLTSLIGNVALVVVFQVAMFLMTEAQPWYVKPRPSDPTNPDSTPYTGDLNTSMYLFTTFQYLFAGIIFNIGPPYRQPSHRNYTYLAVVTVLLAFNLWVLLAPVSGLLSLFGMVRLRVSWRFVILGMAAANFVLCYLGERWVFPWLAVPLAKVFRLVGYPFRSKNMRYNNLATLGYTNSDPHDSCGIESKDAIGLWTRLGQRPNRKEYKVLLQSMPGGSSWH